MFVNAAKSFSFGKTSAGRKASLLADRLAPKTEVPPVDWKKLLVDFVQQEVFDYSFSPPDRRFADSGFFLPDFNEKDASVQDILFMIDTSGSIMDTMLGDAYSQIKSAINQFGGKLQGYVGFFDTQVFPPVTFSSVSELESIMPKGNGGTDFYCIFDYLAREKDALSPSCIVIFTDGEAEFPPPDAALDVPVMWLINNDYITAPWGNTVRIPRSSARSKRLFR